MKDLFDRGLSHYKDSEPDIQMKTRFFFGVSLFNLAIFSIVILVTLYFQHHGFLDNRIIVLVLAAGIFLMLGSILLLIRGFFSTSAHLFIITCLSTIWCVMVLDNSEPVIRLDTIAYIYCIMNILPIAISRKRSAILFYGLLNIAALLVFSHIHRKTIGLPEYALVEYISDNVIVILACTIGAFCVYTINTTTNRKLSQAQAEILHSNSLLRESEEKFSKAFHMSPLAICLLNLPEGRFVDISNSFCSLLDFTPEDIIGKTSLELNLWERPSDYGIISNFLEKKTKIVNLEVILRARTGTLHTLMVSSEEVTISKNPHVIFMGIDVTGRKTAEKERDLLEAQLRQSQKMEAVGHLAGGIAHDFNNMLSVVIGNSELVMMNTGMDADLMTRCKSVHDAALRSAGLVRQLLAFARKQTVSPKVLDINKTIASMLKMLQKLIGESIDLIWSPGDHLECVLIDPSQVDQILANLIVNARDSINGVGTITIETHPVVIDQTYCDNHTWFHPGPFVMLTVSDTGCGMDRNTMDQIFEPFFTTKGVGHGSGLGLATVYGIIKQNNGFIHVYSEPGLGTTFKIYLPQAGQKAGRIGMVHSESALSKGSGTILMVEDDPAILDVGRSILEQAGYTVLSTGSPAEAVAIARTHDGTIDLLITDVVMPKMNGRELEQRIASIRPGIRSLYMSGYTANVIAQHGILDEGVNFLQKPFTVKELIVKVQNTIGPGANTALGNATEAVLPPHITP